MWTLRGETLYVTRPFVDVSGTPQTSSPLFSCEVQQLPSSLTHRLYQLSHARTYTRRRFRRVYIMGGRASVVSLHRLY